MAKDKKPFKAENAEQAEELLKTTKEERDIASEELKAYRKEHGLKKGEDYSADVKHGKKLAKMEETLTAKRDLIEEIKAWQKENKPKKEKAARATTYEYPTVDDGKGGKREMDAGEKKKHRAKMRAEKKKADKGETADAQNGEGKKSKKAKAEEAPAEAAEGKKKKKKETSGDD